MVITPGGVAHRPRMIHSISMHSFILIHGDIYTLDTVSEREHAASHMVDAEIDRLAVLSGGPEDTPSTEGRDFVVDADGNWGFSS